MPITISENAEGVKEKERVVAVVERLADVL